MILGIIGDGQLARMLALAATRLGITTWILTLNDHHPSVAFLKNTVNYNGKASLRAFFQKIHVVTFEREHLPTDLLNNLEALAQEYSVQISPNVKSLMCAGDRLSEKIFFQKHDFPVVPYRPVACREEIMKAWNSLGKVPALLKVSQGGYDGKGQWLIHEKNIPQDLPNTNFILEKRITFEQEIAIIGARSSKGEIALYDLVATTHSGGILRSAKVPVILETSLKKTLEKVFIRILEVLDYVGILALECFLQKDSHARVSFVLNEMAPRVHNAGHWTLDSCLCSQFEQHVRAVLSLPLGSTKRCGDIHMENLLGSSDFERQKHEYLTKPCGFHLYDKDHKNLRKMGHITRLLYN